MTMELLLLSLIVMTAGGVACCFTHSNGTLASRLGMITSLTGSSTSIASAVRVLWTSQNGVLRLPWPTPFGSFCIGIDPLSAFFVIIIAFITALGAVYGVGYLKNDAGRKNLGVAWCFYNLLTVSMMLVVVSRNGLLFLMAWEGMSLTSFFLVMYDHEKQTVREAGWTYLTAAHLGAACLLVMFALLCGADADLDFDRLAAPAGPWAAGVLFILAVLGFGAKAGFIPMHVWLPEAHPAAPSHVSAVMSGVMIKTGIYGLIRIISLLGPPPAWWGWTVLFIGATSGVLGVIYALAQNDLKRLLAYSSVENIGIICLGLGCWLLGTAANRPYLAVLGLAGGLLHTCNHAVFKTLLFLGAGAIKHATHHLDINRLGGLLKRTPSTGKAFLIGAAAICGLPPLNGFISEFLIYSGAFHAVSQGAGQRGAAAGGLIVLLSLALIGGLAAVCFTKVYGIIFLGEPRSEDAACASEVPPGMRRPMTFMAAMCLVLGLGAPFGVALVRPALIQLLGSSPVDAVMSSTMPILETVCLGGGSMLALVIILAAIRRRLLSGRNPVEGPTWDCGYVQPTARMQYTASSFAWPTSGMFRWLAPSRLNVQMDQGDFPKKARIASHTDDHFRERLFSPFFRGVAILAARLHGLQQGRNQLYVLYIAVVVLALLVVKVR